MAHAIYFMLQPVLMLCCHLPLRCDVLSSLKWGFGFHEEDLPFSSSAKRIRGWSWIKSDAPGTAVYKSCATIGNFTFPNCRLGLMKVQDPSVMH